MEFDNPEVIVLNWKVAENGKGYIVRLWNVSDKAQNVKFAFSGFDIAAANLTNMVEVDLPDGEIEIKENTCIFNIKENEIANIRIYLDRII